MSWNLDETMGHVQRHFGDEQVHLIRPALDSLHDRQIFAAYHFREYRRLLAEAIDSRMPEKHIFELVLPTNDESFTAHFTMTRHVTAHVLACVQSLHALADTLAYAVGLGCGLNLPPVSVQERDLDLSKTPKRLVRRDARFKELARILSGISANGLFCHVEAISNRSKHRAVIPPRLFVDATGADDRPYRLRFDEVTSPGAAAQVYSSIDVELLLEPAHSYLSHRIVECGNELNRQLSLGKP